MSEEPPDPKQRPAPSGPTPPPSNRDRQGADGAYPATPLPHGRGDEDPGAAVGPEPLPHGRGEEDPGAAVGPKPLPHGRGEEDPGAAVGPEPLPHGRGQGESSALAYFITFSCYGAWLYRRVPESDDDAELRQHRRGLMRQAPYYLDALRRGLVLEAIQEVCAYRGWSLLAAHVRTNHVHVVVQASGAAPEKVMNDFKAYASRRLNQAGCDAPGRKRWTRHGSTRYLFYADEVLAVMRYVVERQGAPMAVFSAPGPADQSV